MDFLTIFLDSDFTNVLKQNLGHEKLKACFPIRSTQLENKPYDTLEIDYTQCLKIIKNVSSEFQCKNDFCFMCCFKFSRKN